MLDSQHVADDEVYQQLRFDLCPECRKKFLKHPLGREAVQTIRFQPELMPGVARPESAKGVMPQSPSVVRPEFSAKGVMRLTLRVSIGAAKSFRMSTTLKIAVIPGDGTGPEVAAEGLKVLKAVAKLEGLQVRD